MPSEAAAVFDACYRQCRAPAGDACAPPHESCLVLCGGDGLERKTSPVYLTQPIQIESATGPVTVIAACMPMPLTYRDVFTTAEDGQREYHAAFQFGDQPLGAVELRGLRPAPAGVPQLQLTITAGKDGSITVEATEQGTDRKERAELGPVAVMGAKD